MGREGIEPSPPVYKTDGLPLSYRALESYLIQELAQSVHSHIIICCR